MPTAVLLLAASDLVALALAGRRHDNGTLQPRYHRRTTEADAERQQQHQYDSADLGGDTAQKRLASFRPLVEVFVRMTARAVSGVTPRRAISSW